MKWYNYIINKILNIFNKTLKHLEAQKIPLKMLWLTRIF